MQFAETANGWLSYIKRLKPRTRIHYKMVIERFTAFAPVYAHNLKAEHIEHYITHLLENYTNRTANAHLTALKSFCRWLEDSHDVPNPCLEINMLDEDPPKVRVLNEDEYQKVLAVCKPKELDVIRFLANTGLRSSEFQNLTWDNISFDGKFIKLMIVKGRRPRLIPLNKTCKTILNNVSPENLILPLWTL